MTLHPNGAPPQPPTLRLASVLGLVALTALALEARALAQPRPGPEHKRLEMAAGTWTYEGSGGATPFFPAGTFKGKRVSKMVLGGFFLESRFEDKSDNGAIFQAVVLEGYDPAAKTYVSFGFENDGKVIPGSTTVSGNTWTITGVRTDANGRAYKTREAATYAADGKTATFTAEYSPDAGATWLPLWKGTTKRVRR